LLADNNVGIYPINSDISQFYPEQLQGIDLLGDILAGMPDLHLSLSEAKGKLLTSVPSGSKDIGGYVSVSKTRKGGQDKTYGYLDPESGKPVILFETAHALRSTSKLQSILDRKIAVTSGQSLRFFSTDQSAADVVDDGLSKSATLSNAQNLRVKANGEAVFDGLTISLDVPYQGAQQVSSVLQTQAKPLVDLQQMPRRDITGAVHLYNTTGKHIDSLKHGDYGLYQVANESGAIADPITGRSIKASDSARYRAALSKQISSQHGGDADAFMIEGGFQYAPYLQVGHKIYTPYNSDVKMVGANSFLFETNKGDFITAIDLHASENVPLMS